LHRQCPCHSIDQRRPMCRDCPKSPQSATMATDSVGHASSARRPASVILIRPIVCPPAFTSRCVVTSPARMRLTNVWRVMPLAEMAASVAPKGMPASNWSASLAKLVGSTSDVAQIADDLSPRPTRQPGATTAEVSRIAFGQITMLSTTEISQVKLVDLAC
jgi:hypothetical protein